jgi:hypothetical protein
MVICMLDAIGLELALSRELLARVLNLFFMVICMLHAKGLELKFVFS